MATVEALQKKWDEFEKVNFPLGVRGKRFADLNPAAIHSNVAKYVITAINIGGPLSARMLQFLEDEMVELDKLIPVLPDHAKGYFQELQSIAKYTCQL